jgi:hypothetical protein
MEMINSYGILKFDPLPKSGKIDKLFKPFWSILSINDDIDKYYRWFLEKKRGLILQAPAWGPHITVFDGEKVPQEHWTFLKQKYDNKKIEFKHEVFIKSNGKHWWLKALSPQLDEIRKESGLRNLKWSYHITLGLPIPRHEEYSEYVFRTEMTM